MNKYLESIKPMDSVRTGMQLQPMPDNAVVLQVNSEPPATTYAKAPDIGEDIIQEIVSYSAPQKVIVRTYRLRK